ncbi:MAG: efflux RND transporter permease subunit [Elusimicrobia bacterium]|nr:efflux RND transporter permease subunit [Elusimicrobiota bacterium]MBK7208052.1 efflux RND transporter permease subunit [Elusimicrobiota bacterium]MBK7544830.1 efflux RND transporter permease subunit [Elusimicrobiota bacterium]MBK7574342.1 efflux RND transporter permease subunit [Elusimicrobiota bacterium]MBK7688294.1 efflux RND transporter permease subunit [Elusimicrobiota bacterium]
MRLSDAAIKNPVLAWMMMFAMILFGLIGFGSIGKSMLPDVDFPIISVLTRWEGAAPDVMETDVVDIIEDAITSVKGVKKINSTSQLGQARIVIEFDLKTDVDVALQEVQSQISQAQFNLPRDLDPPIIAKFNPEDQPFMWLSLSGDRPLRFLMEFVRDELKHEFTTVPGVGNVFLGGYIEPALRVWLDPEKLRANEITVDDVTAAVATEHTERPAGYLTSATKEWNLRVMGEAGGVAEFENLVIPARNGAPVYRPFHLKDVATIEDGLADARAISRVNGKPAIGLGILKQRNANMVDVGRRVKEKVEALQKNLPAGVILAVNYDGTVFVEDATHELNFNLLLAAILTSFICWLFLGSWSSALNIILAIPTSILGTFIVLYFLGFTQNTFTLLGLTLVVGIVVDDAIMVLENIVRHRELGEPRVKAAILGAREIYFAAMATSVAILAIFVPVVFVKGVIGKYFFQFGITISAAVMFSLVEALTLAPMRCAQFLEIGQNNRLTRGVDALMETLTRRYKSTLTWSLNHRWTVVIVAAVLFHGSLLLFPLVKMELMPPQDQNILFLRMETPVGSSMGFTDETLKKVEAFTMDRGEVERYYAAVGGFEGGEINNAFMFITLKTPKERPAPAGRRRAFSQQELMDVFRAEIAKLPGVEKIILMDLSVAGGGAEPGFPVDLALRGRDWEQLAKSSELLRTKMKETGLMVDVDSNYALGMPEVQIFPNREAAAARGVSVSVIGNAINATLGGQRVGKFSRGGRRYDVRVRFRPEDRDKPADLDKIYVRNNRGQVVPLKDVVTVKERQTLLSITRENRSRAIRLFANIAPGKSQAEALTAVQKIGKDILPEGVTLVFSGAAETFKEAFVGLVAAILLGIIVAYMVLGSQFNSFIHPALVLLALPFSVTGAVLALWVGQQSLNMFSMIGIVLLMGIVKKNSIMLVDFTNERRRALGMAVREALLDACPIRLRPVIMTTVSTIAAAVPPALALGPGAETRVPMALVIIGGVSVSALLTLYVVPCAYSLTARLESRRHEQALKEALQELGELPSDSK